MLYVSIAMICNARYLPEAPRLLQCWEIALMTLLWLRQQLHPEPHHSLALYCKPKVIGQIAPCLISLKYVRIDFTSISVLIRLIHEAFACK